MDDQRPLITHVVFSFNTGGLENGIVNLINHLPADLFRHEILALTRCSPAFSARILRDDVHFTEMNKGPGHATSLYPALYRHFRAHRPAIVHTRNLAALETLVPARAAGVPIRIHGEHGWDVSDPDGKKVKNRMIRRLFRPFVSHYVALSEHIAAYLSAGVGVPAQRISRICNGVDITRFHPAQAGRDLLAGSPFNETRLRVIGTVGRLQAVKDQLGLIRAFARMLAADPTALGHLRLMIVGDGPLREHLVSEVSRLGLEDKVWLAGERADVPEVMRAMDVFVLPSLAEGISNTVLEAMASGLPVIASHVGGNPELVLPRLTGALVPPNEGAALTQALLDYAQNPEMAASQGRAARERAQVLFSIEGMVSQYAALYQSGIASSGMPIRLEPSV